MGDVPEKMLKKKAMVCCHGLTMYWRGCLAGMLVGTQRQSSALKRIVAYPSKTPAPKFLWNSWGSLPSLHESATGHNLSKTKLMETAKTQSLMGCHQAEYNQFVSSTYRRRGKLSVRCEGGEMGPSCYFRVRTSVISSRSFLVWVFLT